MCASPDAAIWVRALIPDLSLKVDAAPSETARVVIL
jgi:hypothetical protein